MELKVLEINNKIYISFKTPDKNEFYNMLKKIKSLTGRIYDPVLKKWNIPKIDHNIKKLYEWGFDVKYHKKEKKTVDTNIKHLLDNSLFSYQKDGVQFLNDKNGRGLIADEMGLGKTLQAISYINLHKTVRPVLIICPATLKLNWELEIELWTKRPGRISVISGQKGTIPLTSDIVIINYDIIGFYSKYIVEKLKPKIIILDESHKIKDRKTKRYKAVKKICNGIKRIIALTGTPILNRPIEIYTTINLLRPDIFPSFFRFANRYCDPKHNGFGIVYKGASNIKELHEILISNLMIRRLKKDVLKELPDKLTSIIPIEIDNKKEYDFADNNFAEWLLNKEKKTVKIEALARLEKLKQLSVKGKLKTVENWIKDILEENKKLVVMAVHHFTIDYLMEKFKDIAVKLDGRDSAIKKNQAVNAFQNDSNIRLFIGNIKAAGVGITLTASNILAFIELWWNPAEHDQAADRIHRIGQKDVCNIYYLVGKNTIEEDIIYLIDDKRKVVDALHDGVETCEDNLLNNLLSKYYNN